MHIDAGSIPGDVFLFLDLYPGLRVRFVISVGAVVREPYTIMQWSMITKSSSLMFSFRTRSSRPRNRQKSAAFAGRRQITSIGRLPPPCERKVGNTIGLPTQKMTTPSHTACHYSRTAENLISAFF